MLVVSTDQAHSLGDVLGIAVPPTGQGDPVRVLAYDPEAGADFDALALDTLPCSRAGGCTWSRPWTADFRAPS